MPPLSNTPLPRRNAPVKALDPQSIESRTKVLVSTGNNQLAAEYIAKQAAQQQALRDKGVKQEIEVKTRAMKETIAEVKLAVTGKDLPPSNPPRKAPVAAAPVFADLTIAQLRGYAEEHGLEYDGSLSLKGDLVTAIAAAHAAKYQAV